MSKRQRRRVTERRSVHMQHSRRRTVLPLAVAAVAAPAVAAPAAQASPHVVRLNGSVLTGLAFDHIDAMARAEHGLRRDSTSAAKAIANSTQTGLFRPRPGRPQRPVAPATASAPAPAATPAPASTTAPAPTAPTIPGAPADALAGSSIAPTPAPAPPPHCGPELPTPRCARNPRRDSGAGNPGRDSSAGNP